MTKLVQMWQKHLIWDPLEKIHLRAALLPIVDRLHDPHHHATIINNIQATLPTPHEVLVHHRHHINKDNVPMLLLLQARILPTIHHIPPKLLLVHRSMVAVHQTIHNPCHLIMVLPIHLIIITILQLPTILINLLCIRRHNRKFLHGPHQKPFTFRRPWQLLPPWHHLEHPRMMMTTTTTWTASIQPRRHRHRIRRNAGTAGVRHPLDEK